MGLAAFWWWPRDAYSSFLFVSCLRKYKPLVVLLLLDLWWWWWWWALGCSALVDLFEIRATMRECHGLCDWHNEEERSSSRDLLSCMHSWLEFVSIVCHEEMGRRGADVAEFFSLTWNPATILVMRSFEFCLGYRPYNGCWLDGY
jgi:hypothetical protein